MKRFYKEVAVVPQDGGFAITLDGRPVRTPKRAALLLPTSALAEAVADEWRAQGDKLDPATMPMNGLANAAIDLAMPDPVTFAAPLAAYAESDLLCYRADYDRVYAARQVAAWNPWLAWAEARFGVEFILTEGVMFVAQPPETVAILRAHVEALPPFQLAALAPLVTIGGSLVLALAVLEGEATAEAIWPVTILDELYQEEQWKTDELALAARVVHQRDFLNAARFAGLAA